MSMDEPSLPSLPAPTSPMAARHRRETLLEITLPAVGGFLLIIAGLVFTVLPGTAAGRPWADTAVIFLMLLISIPLLLFGLVLIVLLVGLWKLYHALPPYMHTVQEFTAAIQCRLGYYANKATAPFITISSWQAAVQEVVHQARRLFKRGRKI